MRLVKVNSDSLWGTLKFIRSFSESKGRKLPFHQSQELVNFFYFSKTTKRDFNELTTACYPRCIQKKMELLVK